MWRDLWQPLVTSHLVLLVPGHQPVADLHEDEAVAGGAGCPRLLPAAGGPDAVQGGVDRPEVRASFRAGDTAPTQQCRQHQQRHGTDTCQACHCALTGPRGCFANVLDACLCNECSYMLKIDNLSNLPPVWMQTQMEMKFCLNAHPNENENQGSAKIQRLSISLGFLFGLFRSALRSKGKRYCTMSHQTDSLSGCIPDTQVTCSARIALSMQYHAPLFIPHCTFLWLNGGYGNLHSYF